MIRTCDLLVRSQYFARNLHRGNPRQPVRNENPVDQENKGDGDTSPLQLS